MHHSLQSMQPFIAYIVNDTYQKWDSSTLLKIYLVYIRKDSGVSDDRLHLVLEPKKVLIGGVSEQMQKQHSKKHLQCFHPYLGCIISEAKESAILLEALSNWR